MDPTSSPPSVHCDAYRWGKAVCDLLAGQPLVQEGGCSHRGGQRQLQDLSLQMQPRVSSSPSEALAECSCPQPEFLP